MNRSKKVRHVLGISGGKDSAALAIYLKDQGRYPEMEYYFADTGCELPETYDFIERLQAYLGKEIVRIPRDRDKLYGGKTPFEHHLFMQGRAEENWLPSPRNRWCTVKMKLEPFEKFVGSDEVYSYIAIRADEHREGYISTKPNIRPIFPFIHEDVTRKEVFRILKETVGVPEYYKWRSRSGCYFCFFQRREEWLGLYRHHPNLFRKAMEYEKVDPQTDKKYTWIEGITLLELLERKEKTIQIAIQKRDVEDRSGWLEKLITEGDDSEDSGCLICSL